MNNQPTSENRIGTYQFPTGFNTVDSNIAETQQRNYVDYMATDDRESRVVESGLPLTPIREGSAGNQYETVPAPDQLVGYANRAGQAIDSASAEDVLARANQVVSNVFAEPETQAAQTSQEHNRQANELAATFGPLIVMRREEVLNQSQYELAA